MCGRYADRRVMPTQAAVSLRPGQTRIQSTSIGAHIHLALFGPELGMRPGPSTREGFVVAQDP